MLGIGAYALWPSWTALVAAAVLVIGAPLGGSFLPWLVLRARFRLERKEGSPLPRPPSAGTSTSLSQDSADLRGEVDSAESRGEAGRAALRELLADVPLGPSWQPDLLQVSTSLVLWVEEATRPEKSESRKYYGLYDYSHEERGAVAKICKRAIARLPADCQRSSFAALVRSVASILELAEVEFDDGIGFFEAAAVTLQCDAEFDGSCHQAIDAHEAAISAVRTDSILSAVVDPLRAQQAGFERLLAREPTRSLRDFRRAQRKWRDVDPDAVLIPQIDEASP